MFHWLLCHCAALNKPRYLPQTATILISWRCPWASSILLTWDSSLFNAHNVWSITYTLSLLQCSTVHGFILSKRNIPGFMLSRETNTSVNGSNSWEGGGTGMGALTMGENRESLSSLSVTDGPSGMLLFMLLVETGMEFCVVELRGTNTGDGVISESKRDVDWGGGGGADCCCCEDVFVAASWFMVSLGGGLQTENAH